MYHETFQLIIQQNSFTVLAYEGFNYVPSR